MQHHMFECSPDSSTLIITRALIHIIVTASAVWTSLASLMMTLVLTSLICSTMHMGAVRFLMITRYSIFGPTVWIILVVPLLDFILAGSIGITTKMAVV